MKQTRMDMLTAAVNMFWISDVDYYQKFLDFCAKNNMHRFSAENQLLIFRQKPDAELCIPYSFWKKQGRVPGKGTGIRIFPEKFYHEDVPYVFDIRDTFGRELTDSSLVWIVSEQTRQELQKSFAAEDFKAAVDVLIHKYLSEHMPSGNMKKEELVFAEEAAAYVLAKRCGLPVSFPESLKNYYQGFAKGEFITKFIALHITVRDTVRSVLQALWNQYQYIQERERKESYERTAERIDKNDRISGGAGRNSGSRIPRQHDETGSRGVSEGISGVHGDSSHGSDGKEPSVPENRQTDGADRHGLPGGASGQGTVPDDVPVRDDRNDNEEPGGGSREASGENRTAVPERKTSSGRGQLRTNIPNPDRSQAYGDGGSHSGNTDKTRIPELKETVPQAVSFEQMSLFPVLSEDKEKEAKKEMQASMKDVPVSSLHDRKPETIPEEYIREAVLEGPLIAGGKQRIYALYKNSGLTKAERAAEVKKEYGLGGRGWPMEEGVYGLHGYDSFPSKGFRVKWCLPDGEHEGIVPWKTIEGVIAGLMEEEAYLSPVQMAEYVSTQQGNTGLETASVFSYPDGWQPNTGGDKARFRSNVEAIKVMKHVEMQKRPAAKEEQLALSRYVGWGGLANAFDERKTEWAVEYRELKGLLSPEEYASARASVTDSFYTPKEVLDGIYQALERMGFSSGTILEPSMGIGNFYSAMPETMRRNSTLYGVEIDSVSSRIAKLLHPDVKIQNCGFEKSELPDQSFDLVIGNVPFGDFSVFDREFKKEHFKIHDYFFAKAMRRLRPGGILAFITSKGTMDKKDTSVRAYLAERAELLGAIRLPNTTFRKSANTDATSDIIFMRKKEAFFPEEPEWLSVSENKDRILLNSYFLKHPDMLLGTMKTDHSRFGVQSAYTALFPKEGAVLSEELAKAVQKLPENIYAAQVQKKHEDLEPVRNETEILPAGEEIRNFCFGISNGELYYRENDVITAQKTVLSATAYERVSAMCQIREALRSVIRVQLQGCSGEMLADAQGQLNRQYDSFVERFGFLTDRANMQAIRGDVDAMLLCSLERVTETGVSKADIFSKATIRPENRTGHTDTALDALYVALNETGRVDLERIMQLCGKDFGETVKELTEADAVFLNPSRASAGDRYAGWESEEEYLSGNVRQKLRAATLAARTDGRYRRNVQKLSEVIPEDLGAEDIMVRIGTTWVSVEDYTQFLVECFHLSRMEARNIHVNFERISNVYFISNKSAAKYNDNVNRIYGTKRKPGLEIMEDLLNMKQIQVFDTIEEDGKTQRVLNQKETMVAKEKAGLLLERFRDWIFQDMGRRETYVRYYNDTFNSNVTRHYDGSYLTFPGMSSLIQLKPHQKDAVARIIRGGNTLLAHCVGAGKSFEMAAGCMELKRLGLAAKPLVVVPKHLTGQMAVEFLTLYPNASLLLTTERDFEKKNRQKFITKIATGSYDAVIMGHSQFEKVGMSKERQVLFLKRERDEILAAMEEYHDSTGQDWTIKNLERQRKKLDETLERLQRDDYKDDIIRFEELGVDALFIDEAHTYKNLSFTTKMTRIPGISPEGSKKSMDLLMKIQYLQEKNPGRNIIFATGTPVSNSMCELYTMQRYLQPERLKELGIYHFDAWAANFGETQSALELAPEGGTYRMRTRFNKFVNLPELMSLYHEFGDVQLPDMLDLPVPKLKNGKYFIVESQPNEEVKEYMDSFVERADKIHNGQVSPNVDNMLKICHDARLLGMDIRLLDASREAEPNGKLYQCVENVYRIYQETQHFLGTQIIFSDIGVPNGTGFNVYDFIRDELAGKGIPREEICFIHEATTDKKREQMFENLRNGTQRIILGSTQKMGTGTNIQTRLYAMHEIDVPWRPSDVEQREGRIIRQGNQNPEVEIYRYVTKGTFDAYNWALIENKQRFISQVMTSRSMGRTCDDVDEAVLNYAEMKAVASGSPDIKRKMEVDRRIQELMVLKKNHESSRYQMQEDFKRKLPQRMERLNAELESIRNMAAAFTKDKDYQLLIGESRNGKGNRIYPITINGKKLDDAPEAGEQIEILTAQMKIGETLEIGRFLGLKLSVKKEDFMGTARSVLCLTSPDGKDFTVTDGLGIGGLRQMKNNLLRFPEKEQKIREQITNARENLHVVKKELLKPFPHEDELAALKKEQIQLEQKLSEKPEGEKEEGEQKRPLYRNPVKR